MTEARWTGSNRKRRKGAKHETGGVRGKETD